MLYIEQVVTNSFHIGSYDKTATVVGNNTGSVLCWSSLLNVHQLQE